MPGEALVLKFTASARRGPRTWVLVIGACFRWTLCSRRASGRRGLPGLVRAICEVRAHLRATARLCVSRQAAMTKIKEHYARWVLTRAFLAHVERFRCGLVVEKTSTPSQN